MVLVCLCWVVCSFLVVIGCSSVVLLNWIVLLIILSDVFVVIICFWYFFGFCRKS